jgi:hypothetical protein
MDSANSKKKLSIRNGMKKIAMRILLIGALSTGLYQYAKAQPGDPGNDPDAIPLDPGSWVLVAAGVGYGVKKWRDAKQGTKNNADVTARFIAEDKMDENSL